MASRCGNVSQGPPLDIGCGPQTRHARRWARESASLRLTEGAELKIYGDLRGNLQEILQQRLCAFKAQHGYR